METNTILDDKEPNSLEQMADTMRSNIAKAKFVLRRQAIESEVKLKGLFVDSVFTKLNLMKYR